MLGQLSAFFATDGFMPHGMCLLWRPAIFWLHLISDSLIAASYYSIPFALTTLVRKRKDLAFSRVFYMFSAFIFLCGTTHLMEIWTLYYPDYVISGLLKVATAMVSLATAIALWPLMPQVLALPSPSALSAVNMELQREVVFRKAAEDDVRKLNLELERRVSTRTAELGAANEQLRKEIEERRAGEVRLRESEERYRQVVNLIAEGIWVHLDDKIVFANRRAVEILGYPDTASLLHIKSEALIAPEFRAAVEEQAHALTAEKPTSGTTEAKLLRADGETIFVEMQSALFPVGNRVAVMSAVQDISDRKRSEEIKLLLAREVDHRAKNALAIAQALVKLTRASTVEAYALAVEGRIRTLARAHSMLSKSYWKGGDLKEIFAEALSFYSKAGQIEIVGPPITITADALQPLSLVANELGTNAFKYGALQNEAGRVRIGWNVAPEGVLSIDWIESGGPPVSEPLSSGFGTTLLSEVIRRQLDSGFDLMWRKEGLQVHIALAADCFRLGPFKPAEAQIAEEGVPATEPIHREDIPRKLLIVEDDTLIAMELAYALGKAGWQVVGPAHSLTGGIDLAASQPDIAAAVLDINLAGQTVYPLAEQLRNRGIPFIFCTGYETAATEGPFKDAPVHRKPVDIKLLSRELLGLLADGPCAAE